MKTKSIIAILIIALLLSLFGCGAKEASADDTVVRFSDAMKTFDLKTMGGCVANGEDVSDLNVESDETFGALVDYFKQWAGSLQYSVVSSEENGDHGTVVVEYTYTDASAVFSDAMADYFTQGMALSLNGASDEEISDLLTTLLVEKAKTAQLGTKQATVNYPMIKADGVWKIEELPEGAMHVVTSDLLRAAAAMAEAISDAD